MSKPVVIAFDPAVKAFVKEAAASAGVSLSTLCRKAITAFAADVMGKPAPEAPEPRPGAVNPFAADAKVAGMTVKGYMRKLACEAKGLTFKPRKGDLLNPVPTGA